MAINDDILTLAEMLSVELKCDLAPADQLLLHAARKGIDVTRIPKIRDQIKSIDRDRLYGNNISQFINFARGKQDYFSHLTESSRAFYPPWPDEFAKGGVNAEIYERRLYEFRDMCSIQMFEQAGSYGLLAMTLVAGRLSDLAMVYNLWNDERWAGHAVINELSEIIFSEKNIQRLHAICEETREDKNIPWLVTELELRGHSFHANTIYNAHKEFLHTNVIKHFLYNARRGRISVSKAHDLIFNLDNYDNNSTFSSSRKVCDWLAINELLADAWFHSENIEFTFTKLVDMALEDPHAKYHPHVVRLFNAATTILEKHHSHDHIDLVKNKRDILQSFITEHPYTINAYISDSKNIHELSRFEKLFVHFEIQDRENYAHSFVEVGRKDIPSTMTHGSSVFANLSWCSELLRTIGPVASAQLGHQIISKMRDMKSMELFSLYPGMSMFVAAVADHEEWSVEQRIKFATKKHTPSFRVEMVKALGIPQADLNRFDARTKRAFVSSGLDL